MLTDLQPIEMLILLAGILFLLLGIAGYILQTVRLKDMEEAKYFYDPYGFVVTIYCCS